MDIVDKEVLPRRIRKESVADFTGEHISMRNRKHSWKHSLFHTAP